MSSKSHFNRKQAMEFARLVAGIRTGDTSIADIVDAARHQAEHNTGDGWRKAFRKLADWLSGTAGPEPPFTVFAEGNSKLPFYAWSTLPIVNCPGAGACAEFCYSLRAWRYPAAFLRQCQNTIFEATEWGRDILRVKFDAIPENAVAFRLYVDGDFPDIDTANYWFELIGNRSGLSCYGYSKSWQILLSRDLVKVPQNYRLNLSSGSRYPEWMKSKLIARGFVRGEFVAVPIDSKGLPGGFKRYESKEYHRRVRESAEKQGYGKVFSCPGTCGTCTMKGHACGTQVNGKDLVPITIAIGVH